MKEVLAQGTNKIQGAVSGGKFFIADDPDVHSKIGELLRDMYQDPVWAVVREYIANALDADVNKHIEVTLPARDCCEFTVQDFGPGLAKDDMIALLTGYGMSNKRGDTLRIGGFGIGSKCGLAYTNSFTYGSVYVDEATGKRRKTVLLAFLDENLEARADITADLDLPDDDKSPTGIKVVVPIKAQDIDRFKQAVYNFTLSRKVAPRIHVMSRNMIGLQCKSNEFVCPEPLLLRTVEVAGHKLGVYATSRNNNNTNMLNTGRCIIVMSGVPYPVEYSTIIKTLDKKRFSFADVLGTHPSNLPCIVVEADGTTDMVPTPSRETIKMSAVGANFIANALHAYSDKLCADYVAAPTKYMNEVEAVSWEIVKVAMIGFHNQITPATGKLSGWSEKIYKKLCGNKDFNVIGITSNFAKGLTLPPGYVVITAAKKKKLKVTPSHAPDVEFHENVKFCILNLADIPVYAHKYFNTALHKYGVLDANDQIIQVPGEANGYDQDEFNYACTSLVAKAAKEWVLQDAPGRHSHYYYKTSNVILLQLPTVDIKNGLQVDPSCRVDIASLMPKAKQVEKPELYKWPPVRPVVVRTYTAPTKGQAGPKVVVPKQKPCYMLLEFRGDTALPHHHLARPPVGPNKDFQVSAITDIRCWGQHDQKYLVTNLSSIVYFIEHGSYKKEPLESDCDFAINHLDKLTPAFYSKRLLSTQKGVSKAELWPEFYKAVDAYVKTRPAMVQEWLYARPYIEELVRDLNGTIERNVALKDSAYGLFLGRMYTQTIRNKDVKDFVYLSSPAAFVKHACAAKIGGLFAELNPTDLWLGDLAEDPDYMGYLFKANHAKDQTFSISVGSDNSEFEHVPPCRRIAKALAALAAAKHPLLYALNSCAQEVNNCIGCYIPDGTNNLYGVFPNRDSAVFDSVTDFVASYK